MLNRERNVRFVRVALGATVPGLKRPGSMEKVVRKRSLHPARPRRTTGSSKGVRFAGPTFADRSKLPEPLAWPSGFFGVGIS